MYRFELENVLEVRKHIEDILRSELVMIEQSIRLKSDAIDHTKEKKAKLIENMQNKITAGTTSSECLMFSGFLHKVDQDINDQINQLSRSKEKRNYKKEELIKAVKNRKALEKLKEKRAAEYKLKQDKIEIHTLDDFSSMKHARQMEAT